MPLLSFSTHGSARHSDADKVVALRLVRERAPSRRRRRANSMRPLFPMLPAARSKLRARSPAGHVLIFPDLDTGNIAYKLTQYLGGARAVGPILRGSPGGSGMRVAAPAISSCCCSSSGFAG
jgi:phosphotransacetylase